MNDCWAAAQRSKTKAQLCESNQSPEEQHRVRSQFVPSAVGAEMGLGARNAEESMLKGGVSHGSSVGRKEEGGLTDGFCC